MKKASVFIDAEYLLQSLRRINRRPKGIKINKNDFGWENLVKYIANGYDVGDVYYYTARLDETENPETYKEQEEYFESIKNKLSAYNVDFRLGKMIKTRLKNKETWNKDRNSKDDEVITWVQKGVDTKIVLDMCTVKERTPDVDAVILISGDSDFCEILEYLNSRGIETVLVSFDRYDSRLQKDLSDSARKNIKIGYKTMSEHEIIE